MEEFIIIGAGPAGLTAGYELTRRTSTKPIILEATDAIGGISQTIKYKGNRMDIGGHRFFSKSQRVENFWHEIMPASVDEVDNDDVMLKRNRISRILFMRKFYDYPITLSINTIRSLGFMRLMRIGYSYVYIKLFKIRNEETLEDFYINRFGKELYKTFFKDYTQKVWGVPCSKIPKDWGSQRVKGLSITGAIKDALSNTFSKKSKDAKTAETSLIRRFLYPKYGPGQLWEKVAERIEEEGGEIRLNSKVVGINYRGYNIESLEVQNTKTLKTTTINTSNVISTMPIRDLITAMGADVPADVRRVSGGLIYRDFMTVGLLLRDVKLKGRDGSPLKDNWIYIQEKDVMVGRLQIFNNWSPYMVADTSNIFIGMEYFVDEGDAMWTMSDTDFSQLAIGEMVKLGIIDKDDVLDSIVVRMPKAYPAYFGTYKDFPIVRNYINSFDNLWPCGRNGLHRYNNSDHSSLSAMTVVDNITSGITSKDNIWEVNTEKSYHEGK